MTNQLNKFRGGIRVGLYSNSWPNGTLEVGADKLVLHDATMNKTYEFLKQDVDKVEIKKMFPIIAYGIRICHHKKDYKDKVYFWYVSMHFSKLTKTLKDFGWV